MNCNAIMQAVERPARPGPAGVPFPWMTPSPELQAWTGTRAGAALYAQFIAAVHGICDEFVREMGLPPPQVVPGRPPP